MKKFISISTLASLVLLASPFTAGAQMTSMVRNMMSQFDEMRAVDYDSDELIDGTSAYPTDNFDIEKIYTEAFHESGNLMRLSELQGGYVEIDGKEYPDNSIDLEFSWLRLPYFQAISCWFEELSLSKEGKDLLMSEKEVDKYKELGIIEDEFNFPMPGTYSETFRLNRELLWEDTIAISGKVMISMPDEYVMAISDKNNIGTIHNLGGISYQLLEMEKNIATVLVKGDRRQIEAVKIIILNNENKPFGSYSSVAIDANLYDTESKLVKEVTDEELENHVKNFNMSEMNISQVKKIQVNGNVDKLVFLKVNSNKELEQAFTLNLGIEY